MKTVQIGSAIGHAGPRQKKRRSIGDGIFEIGAAGRDGGPPRQRASAQQAPMPEDLVWKLLEIGRVIDPPKTAALYRADAGEGTVSGRQDRARRQIRAGRPPSARRLHAGDGGIGPAGADFHPWRRLCRRQQADRPTARSTTMSCCGPSITALSASTPPSARAAIALPGGRRGSRRRRGLGREQDRRARRRSRAHLPDGSFGGRGSCRQLRVASGIPQGEGWRPRRRDDGIRHLRPERVAARRSRDRLFRLRPSRYAERSSLQGLLATKIR